MEKSGFQKNFGFDYVMWGRFGFDYCQDIDYVICERPLIGFYSASLQYIVTELRKQERKLWDILKYISKCDNKGCFTYSEVESLLDDSGEFSDSSSLVSEHVLCSCSENDDFSSGWCDSDLSFGNLRKIFDKHYTSNGDTLDCWNDAEMYKFKNPRNHMRAARKNSQICFDGADSLKKRGKISC